MSESNKHIDLFSSSGCLTTDALKGYSSGQLAGLQKEEVDSHLKSCEICSDALEGIQLLSDPQKLDKIVSEINENLKNNLSYIQSKKRTLQNRLFYIAAAASVILLIGFYFYLQDTIDPDSGSQTISQVVEMEEKSIPPMPKAKSQEMDNQDIQTIKDDKTEQTTQPEATSKVIIKKETIEKTEPIEKEILIEEDEKVNYVAPLKTLGAPESIPRSLAIKEVELEDEEIMEAEVNEVVDIASTQPLEYYIGGIVVYDNSYDEADQSSAMIDSEGLSGKASSFDEMTVAPQIVPSESKKGKGDRKQKDGYSREKSKSSRELNEQNENHFFSLGNEVPQFPGGYEALISFLNSNLIYPKEAREMGLQGQLVISFIVEEDGEISSVSIIRGIGGGCDEEAIRVIESMPAWEPALKNEKPVRVLFNMPITFKLN